MKPQNNTEVFESELTTIWKDENGIVCVDSKPNVPVTKERLDKVFTVLAQLSKGNKVCLLDEMTWVYPPNKEAREYATAQAKKYLKALAIITNTPVARMIGNMLFGFNLFTFPTKMFTDEKEAKQWLKQYL